VWRELASGFAYAFGFTGHAASFAAPHRDGIFTRALVLLNADFCRRDLQRRSRTFGFLTGRGMGWSDPGTFALRRAVRCAASAGVIAAATVTAGSL